MMVLRKKALLLLSFAVPGVWISGMCMASPPEMAAVHSCARAEAQRLHARVGTTRDELDFPDWSTGASNLVPQPQRMIVVARDGKGREIARMLCTYDDHDRVESIRPILNVVAALELNR
jgi:hypothetical protein